MTEEQIKKLQKDLNALITKHNIKHAAICGEHEGMFAGFLIGENLTNAEVWEATLNIGRLWQFARENTKKALDIFDKYNHKTGW